MAGLPARARSLLFDETALGLWPPLGAAWARVGEQAAVALSGRNARAQFVLRAQPALGPAHHPGPRPPTPRRLVRPFCAGFGTGGGLTALSTWRSINHSSHTAAASLRLAQKPGIELVWLPKQCPNLNPVEHLWRELKGRMAANRQFDTTQDELREAQAWVQHLTLQQTFRKAGLCSPTFWLHKLHKLYKNIRDPT